MKKIRNDLLMEEYYEIDYTAPDDTQIEFYIGLQEVNLYGLAENEDL